VLLDVVFTGQVGWCIDVSGPVSAQAVTDASGNYVVPGLPAGTYMVCEEVQTSFQETSPTSGPTCATGIGWTISVFDGAESGFVSFTNLPL
jgi:xanthine dehydrogenase molybdopterin-binding subunit B